MALTKATYGIQKLSGGRGYSVRPWIMNPHTNKKEQIFKQSKKWTKEDAKKYVEKIEKIRNYISKILIKRSQHLSTITS